MNNLTFKNLSDISKIVMGQSPSSKFVFDGLGSGLPFLQGSAEFGKRHPIPLKSCSKGPKQANKGSTLISVRAPVGDTNIADTNYIIGRGLAGIEATSISNKYLLYAIEYSKRNLQRVSQGSTFAAVGLKEIQDLKVPIFDLNAQEKIVHILSLIDDEIEMTEELINKKKVIKKGLLEELLKRYSNNIDNQIKLGELIYGVRGVSYAPNQLLSEKSRDTYILLRSNNIKDNKINFDSIQIVPWKIVTEEQSARPGDIAVCMSNGSRALVGKSAIFDDDIIDQKITVGAFCSLFKPKNKYDSSFLNQLFQSSLYQKHIDVVLAGSAINNLQNKIIEELEIPAFESKKRIEIGEILDSADSEINLTIRENNKKILQKEGLMQDLFTGRIRLS